jgi:CheY-like chemotaxis protein
MRVVITDPDLRAGRRLAADVERLLPSADVLLYADVEAAVEGVCAHRPDVVFVAPQVGGTSGPDLVARLAAIDALDATLVGIADPPGPDLSMQYVAAGAGLVVARPVDDLALRTAMRQRAGGIPGP